jgi:S-adenosyl-L-methionine hydrolase (adenosine-forming)
LTVPKAGKNFAYVLTLLLTLCPQAVFAASPTAGHPNEIAFMTDFGVLDDSVAICRQVMYNINPTVRILDITHEITPFSIIDGARYLMGMTPYVPQGTVFVVVIDPGVGSSRKAIVAKSKKGNYYVLPDNGLLTYVQDSDGIEAVRGITNSKWMIHDAISSTFHGRDIFSPVGAHLANGEDWTQVGPEIPASQLVRLTLTQAKIENGMLKAQIVGTDGPFGNLVTNVPHEEFAKLGYTWGDTIHLTLGTIDMDMPFTRTFSDVEIGRPLAFIDSRGRLGFSLNQTNFARTYNIKAPADFTIPVKPSDNRRPN